MDLISLIIDNRDWLFDGIGVSAIAGGYFLFMRKNDSISNHKPTVNNTNNAENKGSFVNDISINIGSSNEKSVINGQPGSYSDLHFELDKKLYKRLRSMFGEGDAIRFIHENNFAGFSYPRCKIDPLFEFEQESINPDFEFIDKDMQELLIKLKNIIPQFNDLLVSNTFWVDKERNHVPPEWEEEQSERFWRVVNGLNDLGGQMWEAWGLLVRTGREKYGI